MYTVLVLYGYHSTTVRCTERAIAPIQYDTVSYIYDIIVQYDSSVQCVYGTVAAINLYYNSTRYDTQYHHVSSSYCTVHIKYDTQTTVPGTVPGYSTRYHKYDDI